MSMLQANQRHVTPGAIRVAGWTVFLLLALVLAGCADGADDRQFANDLRTPQPTVAQTAYPTVPAEIPPSARPAASPEVLVDRRGAPEAGWWQVDGAVWLVEPAGPRQIVPVGALAIASSPGGNEVAVLSAVDHAYRIDIYDRAGERVASHEDVLEVSRDGATPAATAMDAASIASLDWSPQGSRILLALRSGVLVDIPLVGEPRTIETRVPLTGIEQAAWSPRGDAIAVLTRDDAGRGTLALVDPGSEPARVSVIAPVGRPSGSDKSVEAFDWKPRGDGIVFIQARRDADGPTDGLVVGWDRASNATSIIATGGQGGPTGSVTWMSVAPDGKAVAYIVTMQGGAGSTFVGLFVRSLIDGQLYRVPIDAHATPFRTLWLRDGLVWLATVDDPASTDKARVVYIDGRGDRTVLGNIVLEVAATPVASPAASPAASPVASPAATPVASPAASPVASPAASPTT